jgi:hypothetical protein
MTLDILRPPQGETIPTLPAPPEDPVGGEGVAAWR